MWYNAYRKLVLMHYRKIQQGVNSMSSAEPKKLALIRIWQILKEHSDYDHPVTQEDIVKHLRV